MIVEPKDLPPEVLQAINNIADHYWRDELSDAVTCAEEDGSIEYPHLFENFVTIDNWVNGTNISPKEHILVFMENPS
jgi:hypothetical protein